MRAVDEGCLGSGLPRGGAAWGWLPQTSEEAPVTAVDDGFSSRSASGAEVHARCVLQKDS